MTKPVAQLLLALFLLSVPCAAIKGGNLPQNRRSTKGKYKTGGIFNHQHTDCGCCSKDTGELFFHEHLVHGEAKTLLESGPLVVEASCKPSGVSLVLNLEWPSDLFVFGDLGEDHDLNDSPLVNQVLTTGTTFEKDMWSIPTDSEGNDHGDGAFWLSTGHHVWWGGDYTIGIHRTNRAELALAGEKDERNCIVVGILKYLIPEEFQEA